MKKLFATMALCCMLFVCPASISAQTININIQPSWGPAGYDYAEFYYIPELNIYYDVTNRLYYYLSSNRWIGARYLPVKYKRYDLHSMYKVVLNGDPEPWRNNKRHKVDYKHLRNDRTQTPIRHTTEPKYEESRKNTQPWVDNQPKSSTTRKTSSSAPKANSSSPRKSSSSERNTSSRKVSNTSPRR